MNKSVQLFLQKVERLAARFFGEVQRTIKEVDSWDGAASNYADTEQYCNACLINVNSGDPADWTQDHCMLPVRESGDGMNTYVKQAVHAAAGGHGITQVKKPEDVEQDAWDTAVKAAANELIDAYDEMDETAPDACYELAGKTPPEERALSLGNVFSQVYDQCEEKDPYCFISDLYYEDSGQPFAIIASEGKLFRADISVNNGIVELGEWVEVKIDFPPANTARTTIQRQKDGKVRWFSIADTNALLRGPAEIDSTALFRSFVTHIEETGEYPIRVFSHAGEVFRTGQHDFVGVYETEEGVSLLITSGLYDDTELARREIAAREKNPTEWGNSIGYKATAPPEMLEIETGISIPVYQQGIFKEESTLRESKAAAWMTAVPTLTEVNRMLTKGQMEDFIALFDGDEAAATAWLEANAAERARAIADAGMVTRNQNDPVDPEKPVADPDPAPAQNLTLDEDAVQAIARAIVESDNFTGLVSPLTERMTTLETRIGEFETRLTTQATEATEARTRADERLRALEADDETKRQTWLADLPAKRNGGLNVTYRPRQQETPEKPPTMGDIAQEALNRAPVQY